MATKEMLVLSSRYRLRKLFNILPRIEHSPQQRITLTQVSSAEAGKPGCWQELLPNLPPGASAPALSKSSSHIKISLPWRIFI